MRTLLASRLGTAVRLGVLTAAVLGTAHVSTAVAARHIGLASSTPAKDSHVMAAPKEIRLTFSGPVDVKKASVELVAVDNKAITLDSLRAVVDSPKVAVAKVLGTVSGGTYTVKWKAVAADGALGSGSFNFMYMASGK